MVILVIFLIILAILALNEAFISTNDYSRGGWDNKWQYYWYITKRAVFDYACLLAIVGLVISLLISLFGIVMIILYSTHVLA